MKKSPKSRTWRRRRDSNPRYRIYQYDGLANRWFQPLTHVSGSRQRGGAIAVRWQGGKGLFRGFSGAVWQGDRAVRDLRWWRGGLASPQNRLGSPPGDCRPADKRFLSPHNGLSLACGIDPANPASTGRTNEQHGSSLGCDGTTFAARGAAGRGVGAGGGAFADLPHDGCGSGKSRLARDRQ